MVTFIYFSTYNFIKLQLHYKKHKLMYKHISITYMPGSGVVIACADHCLVIILILVVVVANCRREFMLCWSFISILGINDLQTPGSVHISFSLYFDIGFDQTWKI